MMALPFERDHRFDLGFVTDLDILLAEIAAIPGVLIYKEFFRIIK